MRTAIFVFVMLILATGVSFSQVQTTFKTVANGQEQINGQDIQEPYYSLTGGSGSFTPTLPPITSWLALNTDYTVELHSDRITPDIMYKHHHWDANVGEYHLQHLFNTGAPQTPLQKRAKFESPSRVLIHSNFEEYADDGLVWFRDPWFVNGSGSQPNALLPFGSPHTPTGNENETEAAAFLGQTIESGKPYYSCNFAVLLDDNRYTQVTTPLQRGQWSLYDIYARNESDADLVRNGQRWDYNYTTSRWEREPHRSADIKFNTDDAEVFAFYKAHMQATREMPPTRGNSQRKIDRLVWEYDSVRFYAVYESGGRVWCTWSDDNGDTWQPELLISGFYRTASKPCIAVRSEHPNASMPRAVYVSFVDETGGAVVLRRYLVGERPDNWVTIDSIDLFNPELAHPVITVPKFNDTQYLMMVYEGDKTLQYSLYNGTQILEGEHETSQGNTSDVVFRDLVLVEGFVNWRQISLQPEMPSITYEVGCSSVEPFDIIWREGDMGSMRYKKVKIEIRSGGQDDLIHDGDPSFVPSNSLYIDPHAGPSLTSVCTGASDVQVVAYEIKNKGTYPIPTNVSPSGTTVLSRIVWPITPNYPTNPTVTIGPGYRVAISKASSSGPSVAWNRVTKVLNLPNASSIRPEPVVNLSIVNGRYTVMAAMNYSLWPWATATVQFSSSMPSMVTAQVQTDGLWPALSEGYKPLQIYSGPTPWQSPASAPTPVLQDAIEYDVLETTSGLRKTTNVIISEPMRELVVRKNDSSYALFGVVKPYVLTSCEDYTEVAWNLASDSTDMQWWGDISHCIKTTPFTVPTGGSFEYATELFAEYPSDLDSSAIVLVQFRESSSHALLLENAIDMSGYEADTALYVVDRHDLSSIAGSTVYMCIALADTTSAQSWEVQVITSIDTVQQGKARITEAPLPIGIHLEQNSPNPFNPATTISYGIDQNTYVDLRVYDQLGRCIATLVDDQKSAGFHRANFTANDLPSGVYFYRLTALGQTITKKMTLVR